VAGPTSDHLASQSLFQREEMLEGWNGDGVVMVSRYLVHYTPRSRGSSTAGGAGCVVHQDTTTTFLHAFHAMERLAEVIPHSSLEKM
jgi:hypothetical protein